MAEKEDRMQDLGNTQYFKVETEPETGVKLVLSTVYEALTEKGIQPGEPDRRLYHERGPYLYYQSQKCPQPHHEGGTGRTGGRTAHGVYQDKTLEIITVIRRTHMRIMGLDFGSRTVGVAISDSLLLTAQGVEIIRRKEENKLRQTLARIEELIVENEVEEIVLGLPKNMNDTEGVRVELTKEFKEKLERRTGLPVYFWDERLTTVAADKAMMEAGIRRENRKDYVDMIAATLILQGYLDRRNNEKKKETE